MFELTSTYKKKLTYNDYAANDDGKRYELINGELIMVPAPSTFHQRSHRDFNRIIDYFVMKNSLGEILYAPTDVILDDDNVVQPDLMFISNDNICNILGNGYNGAPDLVLEILSPSSIIMDRNIKKELYEKHGVKEYWLVDLANKTVEVFENIDGKFSLYSYAVEKGKLISKVLNGFEVEIKDILPNL